MYSDSIRCGDLKRCDTANVWCPERHNVCCENQLSFIRGDQGESTFRRQSSSTCYFTCEGEDRSFSDSAFYYPTFLGNIIDEPVYTKPQEPTQNPVKEADNIFTTTSPTYGATSLPTIKSTASPTARTTEKPTSYPTIPLAKIPMNYPKTSFPRPTTSYPTTLPNETLTEFPTTSPTRKLTGTPTPPSEEMSKPQIISSTASPTEKLTGVPTAEPTYEMVTANPTYISTTVPTPKTLMPSAEAMLEPTIEPTYETSTPAPIEGTASLTSCPTILLPYQFVTESVDYIDQNTSRTST